VIQLRSPFVNALKLQTFFARRFGQRFDAAVVGISFSVENDFVDALFLCLFGHKLSHQPGNFGLGVLALSVILPTMSLDVLPIWTRVFPGDVVDDLRIYMAEASSHA